MRNISFALTTEQVRQQTKTVTRRVGWYGLKVGTLLQPIVKGQGLKKGEKPERIGTPIRVTSVRREPLWNIDLDDCCREGFPLMTPPEFLQFLHGLASVSRSCGRHRKDHLSADAPQRQGYADRI